MRESKACVPYQILRKCQIILFRTFNSEKTWVDFKRLWSKSSWHVKIALFSASWFAIKCGFSSGHKGEFIGLKTSVIGANKTLTGIQISHLFVLMLFQMAHSKVKKSAIKQNDDDPTRYSLLPQARNFSGLFSFLAYDGELLISLIPQIKQQVLFIFRALKDVYTKCGNFWCYLYSAKLLVFSGQGCLIFPLNFLEIPYALNMCLKVGAYVRAIINLIFEAPKSQLKVYWPMRSRCCAPFARTDLVLILTWHIFGWCRVLNYSFRINEIRSDPYTLFQQFTQLVLSI